MKKIILASILLCLCACNDSCDGHSTPKDWALPMATIFAHQLNIDPAIVICHEDPEEYMYGYIADCSVRLADRIYPLHCYYSHHNDIYCVQAVK